MSSKHEDIKGALRLRGLTLTDIARSLSVKPATVGLVSQGKGRSARIEHAIATAIRIEARELWPDRYPARQHEEATMTH